MNSRTSSPREAEPGDTITIDAIDTDKNEASRKGVFTKVSTLNPENCHPLFCKTELFVERLHPDLAEPF